MTTDEHTELLTDAADLAYVHIRFSGLWQELTNEEWERLAREHAEQVVRLLDQMVDAEFSKLESS